MRSAFGVLRVLPHMNEDRAARYHRLRRRAGVASALAGAGWLLVLLVTGAGPVLADRARAVAGVLPSPLAPLCAVALTAAVIALGWEVVSLPFVLYRSFLLERKYGLSFEPFRTWLVDHLKASAIGGALSIGAMVMAWGVMQQSPDRWWVWTGLMFGAAGAGFAHLAPTLVLPLFYRFTPLTRDDLRDRLLALSRKAGVPVLGAFEWTLGDKTTRANAALVGLGDTRRIIVSDTLLKDYSEDEIEVILAHELAHHVHRDMWTALLLETAVMVAVLGIVDQGGRALAPAAGLPSMHVIGALPLLLLIAAAASLALAPIGNAWSRHNERRADRFALVLTQRPAAFISAMRRLGAQNLAEERPSTAVYWFFHTHPTIDERIGRAREPLSEPGGSAGR